ncbi:DUF4003 family protein [Clostridium sp. NSJ-6]|uniref:DUF4003 family protein n=1 Tax=Clostridium hominis TaxID=2763036 RepID=A0ABR7DD95_9CLOT|nr:DUF4003 family protein [Clostridium hominis]MBC5629370.1 DUF4003 family protein [Clostridium hominis]MDU2671266.1 DUF4003 family protein [Clostridium sp.]
MESFILNRVNLTVDNYKFARMELRNDGDLLNHFASLVFSHYESEIPVERVREIRKYIKATTPRMSIFRGDILYLISILIASLDKNIEEELIQSMFEYMNLLEEHFLEGAHLALTAYVLARYGRDRDKEEIVKKTVEVYYVLKEKYYNITQDDDYLVCALWALNDIEAEVINDFVDNVFEHIADANIRSKNGIQGLANAILLNGSSGHMYRSVEFIQQLEKRDIKIANQFLPLIGILYNINPRRNVDLVEGVIDELCDQEYEYEYYIDKGFRTIIAISIIAFCNDSEKKLYIDELLAHGILSFINSKNKSMFSEVLN